MTHQTSDPVVAARVPRWLRRAIVKIAAREGLPYSHWIRSVLEEAVHSHLAGSTRANMSGGRSVVSYSGSQNEHS